MPKKTVREMNFLERAHYSLGAKMFHAVIIITVFISIAAIAFGFYLYSTAVRREYRSQAWHTAKTAEALVDHDAATKKITEILNIYNANAEFDEPTAEYLKKYELVRDTEFEDIRAVLYSIQAENEASSVYFAAIDRERSRLIYLIDSDHSNLFCPPGLWEDLEEKEIQTYTEGAPISRIDALLGDRTSVPALVDRSDIYGYLCIAADKLYSNDKFVVLAFADMNMEHVAGVSRRFLLQYIAILLVIGLLIALLMVRYLRKNIVSPINKLADAAFAYAGDKNKGENAGKHFDNLEIRTGDEIENLSLIMRDMENDLSDYVQDLTRVTAEKERINTELDVGKQIQEGMLPHIYPAFPDRPEFDVYASMDAAKEVGGDFYDFFLIDDDHLAVVMADVSGKGIPAALFMMASKILIGNISKLESQSPARILSTVNNQICSNNPAEMFVTVWLGILEISTGKLKAANAGHEYPAVRHADGTFELYKDKHGFVIGGMEGMAYTEYEIDLKPGDSLFEYTDGVTEATNKDNELFGTDRMLKALNSEENATPYKVLYNVRKAIDEFVQDAPQFDDITMLCLEYKGK